MKRLLRIIPLFLATIMLVSAFGACGKGPDDGNKTVISNENTPLALSIGELDGVFNPFFATSAYDSTINGMTQLSMLSTDTEGNIAYGKTEPTVVEDMSQVLTDNRGDKTNEKDYANYYTTYEFLLKDGLKFSDGSPLTIKDVLFNLYLYLDPVYTGSATIYSTNIKGLAAYRAQDENEAAQEGMEDYFAVKAEERKTNFLNYCSNNDPITDQITADIKKVKELFREELETDWNLSSGEIESYKDYKTDHRGQPSAITAGWQVFLIKEGFITLKTKEKVIEWNGNENHGNKTKEQLIDMVYNDMVENSNEKTTKDNLAKIITSWATANTAKAYFNADEKTKYFNEIKEDGGLKVKSISGITTANVSTFKGKTLDKKQELLRIVINGVDPKAIWNFSFGVAPMKYYSSTELAAAADPATFNYGVDFGSIDFMNNHVKAQTIPVGAGPYMASNFENETTGITRNEFYSDNQVYFHRNVNFLLGSPKIRLLKYKVITMNRMYEAVQVGEVAFSDPQAKKETINDLSLDKNSHLKSELLDNLGYGYIGINAGKIKDLRVRKAIMHAMDTSLCLGYYTSDLASLIYRPMSKVSWAYPKDLEEPYYEVDNTGTLSKNLIEAAGYIKVNGVYTNSKDSSDKLKFTFTISGENLEDHPMYQTFAKAAKTLNDIGCDVTVVPDANALSKLASGGLTVWAAAWGSTIDPDMYQVYHKNSSATAVLNWGYPHLKVNGSTGEKTTIEDLSVLIEEGRQTLDKEIRTEIYTQALEKVMDLAVELPTYQRKNLFVYNKNVIDEASVPKDLSAYKGILSEIWNLSLKETK